MTTIAAHPALAPGYRIEQLLHRGLTVDVHSVWSDERDCLCIAKTLRPDRRSDKAARDRLLHEGRLLHELRHPHLVAAYDLIEEPTPIIILPTLTGATLSALIERDAPDGMDSDDVAVLARQLCSALHYLHGHGHLHLDLKPSNIVCAAGTAVVLDLGLAQPPGPCRAGAGTLEYMAPEQLAGGAVDAPADVWGLGGVLYRALTGRRPFARERRREARPDFAVLRRSRAAPALAGLVETCLDPEPSARPSLTDLRTTLDHEGSSS